MTARLAIEARGATLRYDSAQGSVLALADADVEVSDGRLAVLIGPSGCGKTTLLNLIAGFLEPTAGEVLVGGRPVAGPSPRCTVVFQDHALFDWMTVADNVAAGMHASKLARAAKRERVAELLALVSLTDFADLYPHQLSGGMRQRAGLARALAPHPEVIVLDEPFASLDALSREKLQDELRAIRVRTRMTGVLVTHSIEEAVYLADEVYVMSPAPGRVVARWAPELPPDASRSSAAFADATRRLRQLVEETQVQFSTSPIE